MISKTDYSINVTVFNKGFLIERVLESIRLNTVGNYEIIVVLDGCTDDSEAVVKSFFEKYSKISHKILYADNVFETKANNIAAKVSTGDYIIIVQDDIIINEYGWNLRLAKPVESFSDVYAVTGDTAYNYILNTNSNHIKLSKEVDLSIDNCWSDITTTVDRAKKEEGLSRDIFAIRNSVNRGPLLKHFLPKIKMMLI